MTDLEKKQFLENLTSGKITVHCADHFYFGPGADNEGAPTSGCKKCWLVWWLHHFSTTQREQLAEKVEEAYQAVRRSVELVEKGEFDLELLRHPNIQIEAEKAN